MGGSMFRQPKWDALWRNQEKSMNMWTHAMNEEDIGMLAKKMD
jgi:hypothetical protein